MKMLAPTVDDLIGTYRTFGADGPAYKILAKCSERMMRVRVLETGEELDYPVQHALADPDAE